MVLMVKEGNEMEDMKREERGWIGLVQKIDCVGECQSAKEGGGCCRQNRDRQSVSLERNGTQLTAG